MRSAPEANIHRNGEHQRCVPFSKRKTLVSELPSTISGDPEGSLTRELFLTKMDSESKDRFLSLVSLIVTTPHHLTAGIFRGQPQRVSEIGEVKPVKRASVRPDAFKTRPVFPV